MQLKNYSCGVLLLAYFIINFPGHDLTKAVLSYSHSFKMSTSVFFSISLCFSVIDSFCSVLSRLTTSFQCQGYSESLTLYSVFVFFLMWEERLSSVDVKPHWCQSLAPCILILASLSLHDSFSKGWRSWESNGMFHCPPTNLKMLIHCDASVFLAPLRLISYLCN